ncbi:hypothetical protein PYCC9005_004367 [Savitreella phatthalungensis]
MSKSSSAIVAVAEITCKSGELAAVQQFLPAAVEGTWKEPGCESYYFFVSPKAPDTVHAFEIYKDAAGIRAHGESAHFKDFGAKAGNHLAKALDVKVARPYLGFAVRDTESAAQVMKNRDCTVVLATLQFKSVEHATKANEAIKKAVALVEAEEPGTLSYHWSFDRKDASKIYVFERYADKAAAEKHTANAAPLFAAFKGLLKSSSLVIGRSVGGFLKKDPGLVQSSVL